MDSLDWLHIIGHIDMDAFYVSVEVRRRPQLRGRPVIVSGNGPRSVVTTASYEARRFGVGSAMPATRARRLCPDGIFLEPDFAYYRAASAEVMGLVRDRVEVVEVVGLDEAYLDLSCVEAPVSRMRRLRDDLEAATRLTCSIGIGPSKLVAKVASDADKPRGFVVLTQEQARARFAGAPCDLVPGIGPKTAERLRGTGILTLGGLASADEPQLAGRFGPRMARDLRRRAAFEDTSPVTEERKVVSESRETTFDADISDLTELESILRDLVQRLCEALLRQGRRGRTIGIKVRLDDFSTHTRARTLSDPVGDTDQVGRVALDLLRTFAPARPVRLLGVRVAGLHAAENNPDEQLRLAV
jgi:DNA polymerase-4